MIFRKSMWKMWKSIVMHIYRYRIIGNIKTAKKLIAYFGGTCIGMCVKSKLLKKKAPFLRLNIPYNVVFTPLNKSKNILQSSDY